MTQVDSQSVGQHRPAQPRYKVHSVIMAPLQLVVPLTTAEALVTLQVSIDALQVTLNEVNRLVLSSPVAKYTSPI